MANSLQMAKKDDEQVVPDLLDEETEIRVE